MYVHSLASTWLMLPYKDVLMLFNETSDACCCMEGELHPLHMADDADDGPTSRLSGPVSALHSGKQNVPSTALVNKGSPFSSAPADLPTSAAVTPPRSSCLFATHQQQFASSSPCQTAVSHSMQTAHKHPGRWGLARFNDDPAVSRAIGHACENCQQPIR